MNIINSHRHSNNAYYQFDRSAKSYFTTDVNLSGYSDISMVFTGNLIHSTDELRICGFSNSHTRMFWVHEIDKATPIKVQLGDDVNYVNYFNDWSGDTLEHTYTFTYSSNATDGNGISFYEDDTLITNIADTDFSGWTASSILQIGTKNDADADVLGFFGTMRRFQIYNRELTSTEVTTLQTDITGVSSGKIADFGNHKTNNIWYDDVNGYEATNQGDIKLQTERNINVVTNGTFDDTSRWSLSAGWNISGGTLNGESTVTLAQMVATTALISGETYTCTFDVSGYTAGNIAIRVGGTNSSDTGDSDGPFSVDVVCGADNQAVMVDGKTSFTGSIDNLVVKLKN